MTGLERFIEAQRGTYDQALRELRAGNKQSPWMWFIFPQLAGLGRSSTARFYGIAGLDEARAYLADPVLGSRLGECTGAMLGWAGRLTAVEILGHVDALKFASSMTLFEAAGGAESFGQALDTFYRGDRDGQTLAMLGGGEPHT
jgi:uncharacterized protein (DUF1810 family)